MDSRGFTMIPNVVMALMARLSPTEARLMLCILRHTFGYQTDHTVLSGSAISQWTGLDRADVSRGLRKLADKGLVSVATDKGYAITIDETKMRLTALSMLPDDACG
jgi:phage replication O-like protein O